MIERLWRRVFGVRLILVGVFLAVMLPATLNISDAQAQDGDRLIGIQGSARSFGAMVHYNLGGVLPISSPVDASLPDSFATISSGPSTFARASVLNPGDLLSNPDAVLANLTPDWQSGTLPAYPYLISAQSGFGEPSAQSSPAPGLQARVDTTATTSKATASAGRSNTPNLLNFGGITTTSTTSTDGPTVTVTAKTEVSDINILGLVTIEGITTEARATSDGTNVEVSGSSVVGKATIAGQTITIDGEGVSGDMATTPDGPLAGLLGPGGLLQTLLAKPASDLLEAAGITITAGGVVEHESGQIGSISTTGLRIGIDLVGRNAPGLGDLLGLLDALDVPTVDGLPIQIADILELIRGHQIFEIEIAGSGVSLAATSAPPLPEFTVPPTTSSTISSTPAASSPTGATRSPSPQTTAPAAVEEAAPAPAPIAQVSVSSLGVGVGAALVLALLAQPLLGLLISRWTQGILAPVAAAGDPCSMEVPDV